MIYLHKIILNFQYLCSLIKELNFENEMYGLYLSVLNLRFVLKINLQLVETDSVTIQSDSNLGAIPVKPVVSIIGESFVSIFNTS